MEIRHLLKSQAAEVFNILKSKDLEPSDFKWEDVTTGLSASKVSRLVHKSGYYFTFANAESNFNSIYSPGHETLADSSASGTWTSQLEIFKNWVSYLKREIETPDVWGAISSGANLVDTASSETSNEPFTSEQKRYVAIGLDEIKQYLLTAHKLDPELVEGQINYLRESSERMGRKDWINVLISVLVGFILNATVTPDSARDIFRFVGTVLKDILQHQLFLPA